MRRGRNKTRRQDVTRAGGLFTAIRPSAARTICASARVPRSERSASALPVRRGRDGLLVVYNRHAQPQSPGRFSAASARRFSASNNWCMPARLLYGGRLG
jgi:hypothetical protein